MPVLSYVHPFCHVDQGQSYIHTRQWEDRPLQCSQ